MLFFRIKRRRVRVSRKKSRKPTKAERAHYATHKEVARTFVIERLAYWQRWYETHAGEKFKEKLMWKSLAIRNTRSRWGSCSSKGGLNFNYRIIFLPPHLADYLIVHELCHLREMNHSGQFWSLVRQAIPDYIKCRAELMRIKMPDLISPS